MAGQPVKRAMIAALERRAAEAGADSALDYVCEYVATAQGTQRDLCRELSEDMDGHKVESGVLSSWINSTQEGKTKIAEARSIAAHVLAEQGMEILDDLGGTEVTREEVALAKGRAEYRQWLASRWNRKAYGQDTSAVNVNVFNAPGAHLEALRERAKLRAQTTPILPPTEPDYEVITDA